MSDGSSNFEAILVLVLVIALILVIATGGLTLIAIFLKNGGWLLILALIVIAILANGVFGDRG